MAKKNTRKIATDYDKQLVANQRVIQRLVEQAYNDLIRQIAPLAARYQLPKGVFSLSKIPALNNRINQLLTELTRRIKTIAINGINGAWELSANKNNAFADIRLAGSQIPDGIKAQFYNPNIDALEAFKTRSVNGLNLSERIYKQGQQYKAELEAGIGEGIAVGRSADNLGLSLRKYLKEPDLLFRRVKNAKGVLKLSKNAAAFHPGQGVYRSSYKNIMRLTRTENNTAYRAADNVRYKQMPFVIGYEVRLSAQHPRFDVCDDMKGVYPLNFVFIGWHPQCLCFSVAIMMNDEQFAQYQQLVKSGQATQENIDKIVKGVITIPESASQWINDNAERIAGWKQPPLWWKQNSNFVPNLK